MPDDKPSTIRKCAVCNEWTPIDQEGCVHCDRKQGIRRQPVSGISPNPSMSGGCMGAIASVLAIAVIGLSQCTGKDSTQAPKAAVADTSAAPSSTAVEAEVVTLCDLTVKDALISEGSYDPAFRWDYSFDGNIAEVLRKYEAKNAFNASLSSAYDCKYDIQTKRIVFLQTIDATGVRTLIGKVEHHKQHKRK